MSVCRCSCRALSHAGWNIPYRLCSIVPDLLNEAGRPALTVPPCLRRLIWQLAAQLLSRNPLSFCSTKRASKSRPAQRGTARNQPVATRSKFVSTDGQWHSGVDDVVEIVMALGSREPFGVATIAFGGAVRPPASIRDQRAAHREMQRAMHCDLERGRATDRGHFCCFWPRSGERHARAISTRAI
jgi:hypothetical protein